MKNTYIKTLFLACIATFTLIGLQSTTAEAHTEYHVVKGDSLWGLGKKYGVSIDDIKQENNRHDDWIYIGETLKIPDIKNVLVAKSSSGFIDLHNSTAEVFTKHRVVKGDSLSELGQKYSVTIDDIKQENNLDDDRIYIGEVLRIPNKTKVLATQLSKPKVETLENKLAKPVVSISQKEKDLFARLVEAEAKGESYKGKVAVATVVLNRVDSPLFPDTITGVIKQVVGNSYAFSPVKNGEINKPASEDAKRAVEEALLRNDRLNDSIYFYNPDIASDEWIRTRDIVKKIGNHVFAK
ncbi:cell wall hydrolase [Lederbergia wuyishanensis]|uniref:N-acetylmuramoyl-L-alanine amidase n=1 Tax=Lederbergia wuyishanensis TaxID=1347903 RepID=A0ABU0D2V4_9BACI|nr:cell wall hydrolase [Lederbergia wuyishanensis]MCJ8007117.1 LysM peptidoglycan-binding domain-containing protein [Lederbergia wuyishanensis]MDQ0342738.1 N-acetylmuramoyl-L-alanine amidase [Lederbergia wuyishanensis]